MEQTSYAANARIAHEKFAEMIATYCYRASDVDMQELLKGGLAEKLQQQLAPLFGVSYFPKKHIPCAGAQHRAGGVKWELDVGW